MHKLHLGCGPIALAGWVNIDIDSPFADVAHDLTLGLPYPDGSVSHIYAEHFIEHIEYSQALSLLSECKRVLAPEGVVRMTTPDLSWLTWVYLSSLTTEWGDLWSPDSPCILLNEGMRAWGHKFLYDRVELHRLFLQAGFDSIGDCDWHQSLDPVLCNLESRPYHRDLVIEARHLGVNPRPVGSSLPSAPFDRGGIDHLLIDQGRQLDGMRATIRWLENGSEDRATQIQELETGLMDRDLHIKGLEAGLIDRGTHIKVLEAGLADRATHIKGLEAGLADRDTHIKGLEAGLADRASHIKGLEAGLADRDTHIKGLETGLTDRDNHIKGLEAGLTDRDTHIKGLEAGLADNGTHIEGIEAGLRDRDAHIKGLEASLRDHHSRIEGLEATIEMRDHNLADGAAAIRGLEQRVRDDEQRIGYLEGLVARLQRNIVGRLALQLIGYRNTIDTPRTQ